MAFPSPLDVLRPLNGTHEGNRGAQLDLGPGQQAELIKVENGCVQGESVGITLAISVVTQETANEGVCPSVILPLPRARVFWGTGNSRVFADVDFLSGTKLSVIAESLAVHVRYDVARPPWFPKHRCGACLPDYHVQASLGYGGSCYGARFTEVAFVEKPGGRVCLPIPPFTSSFTVLPINNTLVSAHLRPFANAFQVTDVIVAPLSNFGQSNRIDQIPIPNGARWVEIENRQTEGPAMAYVVFGLALS